MSITREIPDTITVKLYHGAELTLDVLDFHPFEPSAYCWDAGYSCVNPKTTVEYFVSTDGNVYIQPQNVAVGVQPDFKTESERIEAKLAEAYGDA